MNTMPLVSIITPSFNAARFIGRTIESVRSQDYSRIEHIVVDGASTDGTTQILAKYPHLIWTSKPDRGQSHALNSGLDSAQGEIIGWLNADDVYQPGAVQRAVDFLQKNPDVDFVYSDCVELNENDSFVRLIKGRPIRGVYDFVFQQPIPQPTIFFRRHVLEVLKGMDEGLHYVMDWEFWLRAGLQFRFAYLEGKPLAGFRKYKGSKSHSSPRRFNEEWITVLSNLLENPQGLSLSLLRKGIQYQNALLRVSDVLELAGQKKRLEALGELFTAIREFPSLSMSKTFIYLFFIILAGGDNRIVHKNRKVNVLYVQAGGGIGGAKISLSHLIRALPLGEIKVFLAVSHPIDGLFGQMAGREITAIKSIYLPIWFKPSSSPVMAFLGKLRRGWYLIPALQLAYFIWKNDIDLVHSNSSASPVGAFAAFLARRPHIWHVREPIGTGTEFPFLPGDSISARFMKKLSREIVCISEYTAQFFIRNSVYPVIVVNGINLSEFEDAQQRGLALKKRLGLENKFSIGMVGSLRASWKEHDLFLRAMALVKSKMPGARFLVFGGSTDLSITEYTRSLDVLAHSLDLTEDVLWVEHVDDIPAMMGSLDVFVHPVSKEGSGRVVMEAMAAGRPVVAVMAGGVPELIKQDQTGVMVEAKNPQLLADAVFKLAQDPGKMKSMRDVSKQYARVHFSHERTVSSILEIYQDVLRRNMQ